MKRPEQDRRELPRALGWVTLVMLVVVLVTGVILYGYYRPHAQYSYDDVRYLEFDVPFGMLVRNLHRVLTKLFVGWVAAIAIVRAILAIVRPATSRFAKIRPWILLPIAAALSAAWFVPWDVLSMWAVTSGSESPPLIEHEGPFRELTGTDDRYDARKLLTAGRLVNEATLRRFYVIHLGVLPVLAATFFVLDAWPLRRRRKLTADS
jgi:quinol-cytochrome oxidoreductase complex cytochrome b subunit